MLHCTNGTYALERCPLNTVHESGYGFLDQYGLNDQYVVLKRQGLQANQIKLNHSQTGSYGLLNQFLNKVRFEHRSFLLQSKQPLGHAQANSYLHGTWLYESLHANEAHFLKTRQQDHYGQLKELFYA